MSDRPRRRRSPPRGRSKSRAKSRGHSPPLECKVKETTTRTVRRYATQTQSYKDFYSGQASRAKSEALEYHDASDSEDSDDDDSSSDDWKRQFAVNNIDDIMDGIGEIEKPGNYLEGVLQEYRQYNSDNDSDSNDNSDTDGESNEDDESEDYSNDEKDQSDSDNTDDDQENNTRDEKN